MRWKQIIEAPIADFEKIGAFDGSHRDKQYQPADDRLTDSPKAISKIMNAFAKTRHHFNVYLVMSSKKDEVQTHYNVSREEIEKLLGRPVETAGRITCVYASNFTGSNPRPLNAWTFAHRMGHAIQAQSFSTTEGYQEDEKAVMVPLVDLFNLVNDSSFEVNRGFFGAGLDHMERFKPELMQLLTMKSAREGKMNNLSLELLCELLAQYLITGGVRLQAPEKFEAHVHIAEIRIDNALNALLDRLVGKIISF